MPSALSRRFYARPVLEVAPDLLGKILCREKNGVLTSGRIVEVEAYLGAEDPASHAYRGKTARNAVMFGPPGYAYVYFTYGNHFCVNVVTGKDGEAGAVLIRALEPVEGLTAMRRRRRRTALHDLASGPGKLTQALAIGRSENGADLTGSSLWIADDPLCKEARIVRCPRIGITRAVDLPYRFLIGDSPFVSRKYGRSRLRAG